MLYDFSHSVQFQILKYLWIFALLWWFTLFCYEAILSQTYASLSVKFYKCNKKDFIWTKVNCLPRQFWVSSEDKQIVPTMSRPPGPDGNQKSLFCKHWKLDMHTYPNWWNCLRQKLASLYIFHVSFLLFWPSYEFKGVWNVMLLVASKEILVPRATLVFSEQSTFLSFHILYYTLITVYTAQCF